MPKNRSLHGLRYAAAARLDQAGCSVTEAVAVLGHRTYEMALKYMAQRRASEAALAKAGRAGMNREQRKKLLKAPDSAAKSISSRHPKTARSPELRPDGGVVTQRTANPLPTRRFPPFLAQFAFRSAHSFSKAYAPIAKAGARS
jgi:hypothetical protein